MKYFSNTFFQEAAIDEGVRTKKLPDEPFHTARYGFQRYAYAMYTFLRANDSSNKCVIKCHHNGLNWYRGNLPRLREFYLRDFS